jgi:hypothetical protein
MTFKKMDDQNYNANINFIRVLYEFLNTRLLLVRFDYYPCSQQGAREGGRERERGNRRREAERKEANAVRQNRYLDLIFDR